MNKIDKEFKNTWVLSYNDYIPEKEKSRESLLTVGNGYLGSRGVLEESKTTETNYPGTYIAGVYNRLVSKVAGKDIENEDFVNLPNWLYINFKIDNEAYLDFSKVKINSIKRELNFLSGELQREMVVEDQQGRQTKVISHRLASMANPHLLALNYSLVPLNYEATISIRSEIDGNIINDGVARYRSLNQQHLTPVSQQSRLNNINCLVVKTVQSEIEIAESVKHHVFLDNSEIKTEIKNQNEAGKVAVEFSVLVKQGQELRVEKIVSVFTSKPDDVENPLEESLKLIQQNHTYNTIQNESALAWQKIWDKIDIEISGDSKSQMLLRLHLYHLMVAASPNNATIDAGIAARGLHGEAYRGHIFWDELYILPLYDLFFPEVAKSVLNYRFKRIEKARENAKQHGYKGAMFPWQSGSDGREETQIIHLNPISGEWGDDYSSLQRHISIAIAYNVWYYFQVTNDLAFMEESGAQLFFEICRFWESKMQLDKTTGKYSISKVMGPDEFHEEHKNSPGGGLKDNAYTNIMVAWLFSKATQIFETLPSETQQSLSDKIKLDKNEIDTWKSKASQLNFPVSGEGIIEQFDGYFELKELDWDAYRKKYTNIYRLDRILKAEGKSPDEYKLAKQADTLMTFYNIDEEDVSSILKTAGVKLPPDYLKKNYDYYLQRTSHGSTLSRVVHATLANLFGNKAEAENLYFDALQSDFTDIQGGTTAEGIHAGVMGGTVLMAITTFGGVNLKKKVLTINPSLPEKWERLKFKLWFKNNRFVIELFQNQLKIRVENKNSQAVKVDITNKKIILPPNKEIVVDY